MPLEVGSTEIVRVYQGRTEFDAGYIGRHRFYERGSVPVITDLSVTPNILNRSAFARVSTLHIYWLMSGQTSATLYERKADGSRASWSIDAGESQLVIPRPSQSARYVLEATNQSGSSQEGADFTVISDATIAYFREKAGSTYQSFSPSGGRRQNVTLEWQVSGEPFPDVSLSGTLDQDFDSATLGRHRHTNTSTGYGSIRIGRQITGGSGTRPVTYTLTLTSSVNTVSATTTINWPA